MQTLALVLARTVLTRNMTSAIDIIQDVISTVLLRYTSSAVRTETEMMQHEP